ncbi:4873_t:CDS:2, partial [Funneliformis caledonium]
SSSNIPGSKGTPSILLTRDSSSFSLSSLLLDHNQPLSSNITSSLSGRIADNEINLHKVRDWLKNFEDNLLQAKKTIAERDRELQNIQNTLKDAETLNEILQEDLAKITEKSRSLSGGFSSEKVSIEIL